jgi:hypothetical protein
VIILLSLEIPLGVQTDPLGPRVFPMALGLGMLVCGLLLAASEVLFRGQSPVPGLLSDAGAE